ncbi:MAG: TetR/AcrR family transcriptional regulator [Epulopiscium sp.]|nr:TetR/AcrR family transcriptional regulator [Candidatus Epulonipiscium sp.]
MNEKKEAIINAAIEVIKEKSIEEATMREIASKANITTGAIYHYYKNKEELFYDIINHFVLFGQRISDADQLSQKTSNEILENIKKEVGLRLSKVDEQKLHILLLSDVISKDGEMKEIYKADYEDIIKKIADTHYYLFGIENEELKTMISAIFLATLDGLAIQTALGVIPEDLEKFIEVFNTFFAESVPTFLKKH